MTLQEKIILIDQMISVDPDATIKDYIMRESKWKPSLPIQPPTLKPVAVYSSIFQPYNASFMFGYLGLLRKVAEKYKPAEDQITCRPKAQYSNRSPLGIANEVNNLFDSIHDDH